VPLKGMEATKTKNVVSAPSIKKALTDEALGTNVYTSYKNILQAH